LTAPSTTRTRSWTICVLIFFFFCRHNISYHKRHSDVGESALRTYSYIISGAVELLVKNYLQPHPEYNFPTPPKIRTAIDQLIKAFKIAAAPSDDLEEDQEEHLAAPALQVEDEEFIVHEDEDDDEREEGEEEEREPEKVPVTIKPTVEVCPTIHPKLRELLVAIYTEEPGSQPDRQFFNVFMRYLVLSSIQPSGEWKKSTEISSATAAILFCGRLTLFSIMDDGPPRSENYRYVE
jgi:hypothetical protein